MINFLKNPAVYAIITYCILYLTSLFTFGIENVKNIVDYGVLIVSLLFFWKWFPNSLEAFKAGGNKPKFRLSLGLALTALALAAQRFWIIIVNQMGVPEWISRETVSSFIGSWFIGAMLLCLSVDSTEDGILPHLKWYYTIVLLSFGVIIGFVVSNLFFFI